MSLDSPKTAQDHLEIADRMIEQGNTNEAFRHLSLGFGADVTHKPLYEKMAGLLKNAGAEHEAALFENALNHFDNVTPLVRLGAHYMGLANYDLAFPFLMRAYEMNPNDLNVAYRLSITFAARFEIQKALYILEHVDLTRDFWLAYRFFYYQLLCGKQDGLKQFLETSYRGLKQMGNTNRDGVTEVRKRLDELDEIRTRIGLVRDPQQHIRDWQFIQYGTAVLDYFEDYEQYIAGGRYIVHWGSLEGVRALVEKIARFVRTIGHKYNYIAYMPDRDSEIVARMLAPLLELELHEASKENTDKDGVLIVAGDSAAFNSWLDLMQIRRDQTLVALNHSWLKPAVITPDVAGLFSQSYTFPWAGGRIKVDRQTGESSVTEADSRDAATIAAELLQIEAQPHESYEVHLEFFRLRRDYLKGGAKGGKQRWAFKLDSPVPAAYLK